MPSPKANPNSMKPEKITKAKSKAIKNKLAKHFKGAKYLPILAKVETCTDQGEIAALVLAELGINHKLYLG